MTAKSGWFDSATFEIWFFKIFMEKVKQNPGKYILFEDNLASNFNINVAGIPHRHKTIKCHKNLKFRIFVIKCHKN